MHGVSAGAGWNVCAGEVGTAAVGAGVNIPLVFRVPIVSARRACVGARLSVAAFLAPCWGRRRSMSAWTCKGATEDARALMLSRIWLI